jgi:amidase/aspartyl-tRNA(Asn)/glutamyl-tRNA(Gln) amidotransferase subunit A
VLKGASPEQVVQRRLTTEPKLANRRYKPPDSDALPPALQVVAAAKEVSHPDTLLITPTLAAMPVDNTNDGNTAGPKMINGEEVDPLIGWCLNYFVNFPGHSAASIPAGLSEGLPVGMQIIGRRYADTDVLAASAAFERLQPWQDSYRIPAQRKI